MTIYKLKKTEEFFIREKAYEKARELLTEDEAETTIDELLKTYPSEIAEFLLTVKDELFEFLKFEVGEMATDLIEEAFEEIDVIE